MTELHTVVWEISWPAAVAGLERRYPRHNAIGDYRVSVHPDAKSRELVYRDEAEAEIAALRADAERYRSIRDGEWCRGLPEGRSGLLVGNFDADLDAAIDAAGAAK